MPLSVKLVRHWQTKGKETDMFEPKLPRHTSTLHEPEKTAGRMMSVLGCRKSR